MTHHVNSFETMLSEKLTQASDKGQFRQLTATRSAGVYVEQGGKAYLSFCSNDYLGIAQTLLSVPDEAIGAGASRLLTGNAPLYHQIEQQLATMKNTEAALLFGSGYLANIGAIPALVGKGDLVLMDKASHACMMDGATLSGAAWYRYRHNDMAHLEALLDKHRSQYRHCLILTETVFSMDGDRAPLLDIDHLAAKHQSWLMTDDAHGFGLPMPYANPAQIQMGTLSKAAGCYGGYVCGSQALIDMLINHASSMIFSTALPPALLHSIAEALTLMQEESDRVAHVIGLAHRLSNALDLPEPESAIIPIVLGENEAVINAQEQLKASGILVSAIRPPTVPQGTARLRISLTAEHTEAEVGRLVLALQEIVRDSILLAS